MKHTIKTIVYMMAAIELCSTAAIAQTPVPDGNVIYLDLSLGNISINGGTNKFSGYVGVNGKSHRYSAQTFNPATAVFYIYQSSTVSGSPWTIANTGYASQADFDAKQNIRIPEFVSATYDGKPWAEYITNNPSVEDVADKWETAAAAVGRSSTPYFIRISGNNTFNVIIDNLWSSLCDTRNENDEDNSGRIRGGITIRSAENDISVSGGTPSKVNLRLKGDNRMSNLYYAAKKNTGYLKITSFEGDGNKSGSLTLAFPKGKTLNSQNYNNAAILGCGSSEWNAGGQMYGLEINGGTLFAGCQKTYKSGYGTQVFGENFHPIIHVIGARNQSEITVNGGRLTAVSNGTAAAIGGGGGYTAAGGVAYVTINGGEVYAYNHSIYTKEYSAFVPCVAIGGGSGVRLKATEANININGGIVFAQSAGGVAIGGGGSSEGDGGDGILNITGGEIQARSIAGLIDGKYSFDEGSAIGGGTGNTNGGNSVVNISGSNTILRAGSVGGGKHTAKKGKVGSANISISDGDIQAQFIMQAGSTSACSFTMTGGILHNSNSESTEYVLVEKNGGALWINDTKGNVTISGGTISNCKANNGGAIYQTGGTFTLSGDAVIEGNTAYEYGGALYISGGTTEIKSTNAKITGNESYAFGGGLYVSGGNVTFSSGRLSDNTAVNGGGLFLASGASMKFTGGLIAKNHAKMVDGVDITTAYNAISAVANVNGCGGGIYLQSGTSSKKSTLIINVDESFGLYGNIADRAGDDIVAEGVNTSVTVPNVTAMDLKDFEGKDAQPNWYEDYVYVQDGSDSGYADHSILKYSGGSGNRFKQMLVDGSGDIYNHLVTFDDDSRTFPTSAGNDGYVCLSLGYTVLSAIIRATGLNEKESMYFTLEQLVKPEGASEWTVKNTYPVLVTGNGDAPAQRIVRNLMPGQYRVKQFNTGSTPWAWAYTVKDPADGFIQKKVTKEDGVNNLFPFTVKHVEGDPNVLHDEEYKVNKMLDNAAIVPNIGVEDYKKKNDVHVKF